MTPARAPLLALPPSRPECEQIFAALPPAVRGRVREIVYDPVSTARVCFDRPLDEVYAGQRARIATALFAVDATGPDWIAVTSCTSHRRK